MGDHRGQPGVKGIWGAKKRTRGHGGEGSRVLEDMVGEERVE